MTTDVFLSHVIADADIARELHRKLELAGIGCSAPHVGVPGNGWETATIAAVERAKFVVVILSSTTRHSARMKLEVRTARSRRAIIVELRLEQKNSGEGFDEISRRLGVDWRAAAFDQPDQVVKFIRSRLNSAEHDPSVLQAPPSPPSGESRIGSGSPPFDLGAAGEDYSWASRRAGGTRIGGGGEPPDSPATAFLRPSRIGAGGENYGGLMRPLSPLASNPSYAPSRHATSSPVPAPPRPAPAAAPSRMSTTAQSPRIDAVGFGVAHPAAIDPRESFVVEAWLFRNQDRGEAEQRALAAADGDSRFRSQGSAAVPHGAKLSVTIKVADWPVTPRRQEVWWTGDIANIAFRIPPSTIPGSGFPAGAVDGECRISLNGLRIGFVPFQITIGDTARRSDSLSVGTTVKSAFASYASRDQREVLTRVQGIEKAGIDVFMDVRNLRSGSNFNTELLGKIESSDVLYLFWSRHAAASEWVSREWRHGVEKKGIDFIDPVPLTDPRKVPPPAELAAAKHFNDWTLAYLEYEKARGGLWRRLRDLMAGA